MYILAQLQQQNYPPFYFNNSVFKDVILQKHLGILQDTK